MSAIQNRLVEPFVKEEQGNVSYHLLHKTSLEDVMCPKCGIVLENGRWQLPEKLHLGIGERVCPACQRIEDKNPGGLLTLRGEFVKRYRSEILRIVYKKLEEQKNKNPINRLMQLEEVSKATVVMSFTDQLTPLGLGKAIKKQFHGDLDIRQGKGGGVVRVNWNR